MEHPESTELLEQLVLRDLLVFLDSREKSEIMVRLDPPVRQDYLENLECLVLREEMVDPVLQVPRDSREIREIRGMLVYLVHLELMVNTENVELLVLKERRVRSVTKETLDQEDHLE
jgi:hypothetical protein